MKLAVFVIDDAKADAAVDGLVAQGFRVTRLASTGGFLRRGNTTLLVGLDDQELERARRAVHDTAPGSLMIALDLERYERL
ncbi:cyclic-di-AMP receptor [Kallotenue papyrolyticum]|uniref:cyclic-di-AMP receptor n=1 Tax=Kallotenue papyrolyticum TaxID=1325125 RepID=UPI0004718586|nr:cyclic-di-AMP receptor [Kallotenue papyrolyticum]